MEPNGLLRVYNPQQPVKWTFKGLAVICTLIPLNAPVLLLCMFFYDRNRCGLRMTSLCICTVHHIMKMVPSEDHLSSK